MNKSKYLYKSEDQFVIFKFYSEGPKGRIAKMVEYTETATSGVYNLAFGDYDETTNTINDLSVTNNGDSLKVLATVVSTVYAFFDKHPNAYIVATGSTNVRTRLYRMGITNNMAEIKDDFELYGLSEKGTWEDFQVGEDYEAFLITKKS
jgi:hypothetical protein